MVLLLSAVAVMLVVFLTNETKSNLPILIEGNKDVSVEWARKLLASSEYEVGSYSGIESSGKSNEIWIIGSKIQKQQYIPDLYIGVKNVYGEFFQKIGPMAEYSVQGGDDLVNTIPNSIEAKEILTGDVVAVRTTYIGNFPTALEVRKLIRSSNND